MKEFMVALLSLPLLMFNGCLLGGCSWSQGPGVLTDSLGKVSAATADMIRDQGVMDDFSSSLDGQLIEPGFEAYAGLIAVSGVRLTGVSGRMTADVDGSGSKLPAGVRQSLIDQLPTMSDTQRANTLELLGWNRSQVPIPGGSPAASAIESGGG